jgi:hypothetical protein
VAPKFFGKFVDPYDDDDDSDDDDDNNNNNMKDIQKREQ